MVSGADSDHTPERPEEPKPVMDADDNLIEARLRQLQHRSQPEPAELTPDQFWPTPPKAEAPSPRSPRWIAPLVGLVVGMGLMQLMGGGREAARKPVTQAAGPSSAAEDPTTTTLATLIAAPAATAKPKPLPERAINRNEIDELLANHKLAAGRKDPFSEIAPELPAAPAAPAAVAIDRVLVPDPPPAPEPAPVPQATVRFSGSMTTGEGSLALVEETSDGKSVRQRWRVGDLVLGGYRVVAISLKTVQLRGGNETHLLAIGSSVALPHRHGESASGLSALAPEPARARAATWQAPVTPPSIRMAPPVASPSAPAPPAAQAPPAEPAPAPTAPEETEPPSDSPEAPDQAGASGILQ